MKRTPSSPDLTEVAFGVAEDRSCSLAPQLSKGLREGPEGAGRLGAPASRRPQGCGHRHSLPCVFPPLSRGSADACEPSSLDTARPPSSALAPALPPPGHSPPVWLPFLIPQLWA